MSVTGAKATLQIRVFIRVLSSTARTTRSTYHTRRRLNSAALAHTAKLGEQISYGAVDIPDRCPRSMSQRDIPDGYPRRILYVEMDIPERCLT